MRHENKKTWFSPALTLIETVISLAIMAILFAVFVPHLRVIQNSWDSNANSAEALQNGRVLIDHLNRNLSKTARITAVSDSNTVNGYIEFTGNDANSFRYDVNAISNYVEFGLIGNLSEMVGPVSQLLFTCYDSNDLDTPITDVNSIRFIKVQTTLTNPAKLAQDMTFSTQAYIRTNALPAPGGDISKMSEPWLEYDTSKGMEPALCQIDPTHYLCAYRGDGDDGWAVVLTVDTGTWAITKETPFEFDTDTGISPALSQIDSTHYLCAYQGEDNDGWVRILKVNTGSWTISEEDNFEFDEYMGETPALVQIDQTHYLCAYVGDESDGWAVVFSITAPLFDAISMETPFEFETDKGTSPALSQIDGTHYLCAYTDKNNDGWATVLTVNSGTWAITKETPFEFDTDTGISPALSQIDSTHYLCTYTGKNNDGWTTVLTVNTGTWAITKETPFEFSADTGLTPQALTKIDDTHYLCVYTGKISDGWSTVLMVDTGTWEITKGMPFEFDADMGLTPAIAKIDDTHYLCAYNGPDSDGWAGVLTIESPVRP